MFRTLWLLFAKNPGMIIRPFGLLGGSYKVNRRGMIFYKIALTIPFSLFPLSFLLIANNNVFHVYYLYIIIFILLITYLFLMMAIRNGQRIS